METKSRTFDRDKTLEEKFDKHIKAILGMNFITRDIKKDLEEATDFLIYSVTGFKVGARLRRHQYLEKYGNEFTVRNTRPSGVKTEMQKIKEGLVQFMFYGFINEEETKIIQYVILDLKPIQKDIIKPKAIFNNNPPDSTLAVYTLADYPKEYIIGFY